MSIGVKVSGYNPSTGMSYGLGTSIGPHATTATPRSVTPAEATLSAHPMIIVKKHLQYKFSKIRSAPDWIFIFRQNLNNHLLTFDKSVNHLFLPSS